MKEPNATLSISDSITAEEARHLIDDAIRGHQTSISILKSGCSALQRHPFLPLSISSNICSGDITSTQPRNGLHLLSPSLKKPTKDGSLLNTIRLHEASILSLKSQRNKFAPISILPEELLLQIFYTVKEKETEWAGDFPWIRLTHVSRSWRKLGLESPRLWDMPPLRNLEWTNLMLERSKSVTLKILSDVLFDNTDPGLKVTLSGHAERVRDLSLRINSEKWRELHKLFPRSTVHLETLELQRSGDVELLEFGADELRYTPNLRCLKLSFFRLDMSTHAQLLRGLTSLELYYISYSQMTWRMFADVLKGMPDLQDLNLRNAFPMDTKEKVEWEPVYLASLKSLRIDCFPLKQAELFLSCIAFPPSARVTIDCQPDRGDTNADFSLILTYAGQIYATLPPNEQFRTLILQENYSRVAVKSGLSLRMELFTSVPQDEAILYSPSPRFVCSFSWKTGGDDRQIFDKTVAAIFSCGLPLQNISHMKLSGMEKDIFKPQTFGRLDQVQSLVLSGSAAPTFVDALHVNAASHGYKPPRETIYFPKLSSLYFHIAEILSSRPPAPFRSSYPPLDLVRLYGCLSQRARVGARLSTLSFDCCHGPMREAGVRLLGEFVNYVVCKEQHMVMDEQLNGKAVERIEICYQYRRHEHI